MKLSTNYSSAKAGLVTAFFFLAGHALRVDAAPVRVAGMVMNRTTKAAAPGVEVQLLRPAGQKAKETPVAKTKSDARGRFDFGQLDLAADDFLIARARWQNYAYEAPAFDGGGRLKAQPFNMTINPTRVEVDVFDSTKKYVPLQFMVHHLAIETQQGGLKCTERMVIENNSSRTFMGFGEQGASVLLDIPPAARDVKLDPTLENLKLVKTKHGYAIAMPVTPAAYNQRNAVIVHYNLDWPSWMPWKRQLQLTKTAHYPTKFFFVAREEDDRKLQVTAPKLSPDQEAPLNIEGKEEKRIINMIGRPMGGEAVIKENEKLDMQVSLPVNPLFWGFLMFMVVLCLLVPLTLLRLPRRGQATQIRAKIAEPHSAASVYGGTSSRNVKIPVESATDAPGSDFAMAGVAPVGLAGDLANSLIRQIAELDDRRELGEIEDAEYQAQRATWKEKLVDQMLAEESNSTSV